MSTEHPDRLSDEEVAAIAAWTPTSSNPPYEQARWLACEVQEFHPIDALCARHDITVAGIVALVDWTFDEKWQPTWVRSEDLRRLARQEQQ